MHLSITINLGEYHVCMIYAYEYDNIMYYIIIWIYNHIYILQIYTTYIVYIIYIANIHLSKAYPCSWQFNSNKLKSDKITGPIKFQRGKYTK